MQGWIPCDFKQYVFTTQDYDHVPWWENISLGTFRINNHGESVPLTGGAQTLQP